MAYNLLIPKNIARKEQKSPGGEDFWSKYWKDFKDVETYTKKIVSIKRGAHSLSGLNVSSNQLLYAEVKLADEATVKTSRPSDIWRVTNLDIVESKDSLTYTVSGKKEDFKRLEDILGKSSFDHAKTGEGIKRKDKNIFREAFAISSLVSKNTGIEERVDLEIDGLMRNGYSEDIQCLIEFYSNIPPRLYNNYYLALIKRFSSDRIFKRNPEFFVTNASFRGILNIKQIANILEDISFNFISKILVYPGFTIQRCIPEINLNNNKLLNPQTSEIVGVFDSGVDYSLVNPLIFQHENFIGKKVHDKNHGTFVASRLLFGDGLFSMLTSSRELTPLGKILDIQVIYLDKNGRSQADLDTLQNAIVKTLKKYKDSVFIYNFSISQYNPVLDNSIDVLTEFIDQKCREYDVIFVCSVGNHTSYQLENYENIFSSPSLPTRIASPSDALNVISAGSIALVCDASTICSQEKYPSPFTRKGGIRGQWKKPELVMNGGNIKSDSGKVYSEAFINGSNNTYGVEGINMGGLHKNVGTSFSTPLVTRQCVLLWDYLKKSSLSKLLNIDRNRSNLIKGLLIHSTAKTEQASIDDNNIKLAYGFGVPEYLNVIRDNENQFTFVYCDILNYSNKKHKIPVTLPSYLLNKPVELLLTLVYNPPVNRNFPQKYNMIDIECSTRILIPTKNEKGEMGSRPIYFKPSKWDWENYKTKDFNTIHYKAQKKSLPSLNLEILLQMNVYEEYEKLNQGYEQNIDQPYSLIVTVIDKTEGGILREKIMASNQFQELIENTVEAEVVIEQ